MQPNIALLGPQRSIGGAGDASWTAQQGLRRCIHVVNQRTKAPGTEYSPSAMLYLWLQRWLESAKKTNGLAGKDKIDPIPLKPAFQHSSFPSFHLDLATQRVKEYHFYIILSKFRDVINAKAR